MRHGSGHASAGFPADDRHQSKHADDSRSDKHPHAEEHQHHQNGRENQAYGKRFSVGEECSQRYFDVSAEVMIEPFRKCHGRFSIDSPKAS